MSSLVSRRVPSRSKIISFTGMFFKCALNWHNGAISLHYQNNNDMNTDNTLAFISSMISSEASYKTLVDMINDMDLELMDISLA